MDTTFKKGVLPGDSAQVISSPHPLPLVPSVQLVPLVQLGENRLG